MQATLRCRSAAPGQMIIMLAFMIVVLLGLTALVLDLGLYYREKASLQGVADAAALAAVDELPDEYAAEEAAFLVLEENNYLSGPNGVGGIDLIPNPDGEHPARYLVCLRRDLPAYFSRILRHSGTQLQARALSVFLVKGIVPWMFYLPDIDSLSYGREYTLKQGPLGAATGNFGALRLGGSGAKVYENNVIHGYQGFLELGAELQTEPGNVSGPTQKGVRERLQSGEVIVMCPATYDTVPHGASSTLTLDGFAAFQLKKVIPGPGNKCYVQAVFLNFKTIPWAQGGLRTCLID